MKKTLNILLAVLVSGILGTACATPPTEDMNRAVDTVTRAENDADAVTYAGSTLTRARSALEQMRTEADSKRYESAKNYAAEAVAAAEKAISDGKTGAARAREDASGLLRTVKPEIDDTESALNAAKQVQNIRLDFDSLDGDLASAKAAYTRAETSFNAGRYGEVASGVQPIRPLLSGIRARITDATAALSRKK
jgi:hypothetical protein